ncbi:MAG TPA: protein translocase subunit SecD [Kofleriaceae bacterium]|nr:protein translocase subunit SecD [Kofleriaceae bacterium]
MDRSLKWRFLALAAILLYCVAILTPSFPGTKDFVAGAKKALPSFVFNTLFSKRINLGLDLQGGLHIVYSIDLDKAIDDRAGEIRRDIESRLADKHYDKSVVKTPAEPLGAVTVLAESKQAHDDAKNWVEKDYIDTPEKMAVWLDCPSDAGANALCFKVSEDFAEGLKKSALTNAVSTIRERINEKGVAEPSVVEKGDQIIVELPGIDDEAIAETKDIIARTAKLEMKVVDDCTTPSPKGCTKDSSAHDGSPYMKKLFAHVGSKPKTGEATDPEAVRLGITADITQWKPEDGGATHTDYFLKSYDRTEMVPEAWAKKHGCLNKQSVIENGQTKCNVTGREIIERYLFGDPDLNYQGLAQKDPSFKVPDDHQIGFEPKEPEPDAKDKRKYWLTYYLESGVRLTGSSISNAFGTYDPNTNRPVVDLEFNRYGAKVFGDVTTQISGMKFATILDDKVKSAPIINGAITGGRCTVTMGSGDPRVAERERDELVAVLKTGSLPAPLREETASKLGATLGSDAIAKTRMSFIIGIVLVILIMVGVYKWSGWIAVFAVVFHILMTLAVMALFGATLTLPGIAAIVLSIGMEVDGNILIYERIRDELLLGKSVRGAIDLGFSRAFSAILDGQLTTAAAGWVLLQYGSGPIKGFAVMLLVGVFTTLTTNIWVTRILFDWTVARHQKSGQLNTLSI